MEKELIKFPAEAKKLKQLLEDDQNEWRRFSNKEFRGKADNRLGRERQWSELRKRVDQRAQRMLQILEQIKAPLVSNIGQDGAIAISVLATHHSLATTKRVLAAFVESYNHHPTDTHYQSIPAMTDWICLLERKPQQYGTMWLFDKNKEPYLPAVEDFEQVNQRRAKYGLGPLRWPKSLAIPESEQPWLKRPLAELVMRQLSEAEYEELSRGYL